MKSVLKYVIVTIITWEARLVLWKYHPKIIAVTGSVGKTSAKDAIYTAIEGSVFVRKSKKSMNSETGVPLTILGAESGWDSPLRWLIIIWEGLLLVLFKNHYPRWLVLEVGADHPGDIEQITRWVKPDIAVITGIPDVPVHVTHFSSVESVVREKRFLAEAVKPGGALILNMDDVHTAAMQSDFRGITTTYGFAGKTDFSASHDEMVYKDGVPIGMRFRLNEGVSSIPMTISGALGRTHIYPLLAACAVGREMGIDFLVLTQALNMHQTPPGRMRLIEGMHGCVIIDDSYNASPVAMSAALETLKAVEVSGKKIAVLGDMRELGRYSKQAHREAGTRAAGVADVLVTVGEESRVLAEAAHEAGLPEGNIYTFGYNESAQTGIFLREIIGKGDVVLVKGSQNMIRLERVVKALMLHPDAASALLVRQEKEWLES